MPGISIKMFLDIFVLILHYLKEFYRLSLPTSARKVSNVSHEVWF